MDSVINKYFKVKHKGVISALNTLVVVLIIVLIYWNSAFFSYLFWGVFFISMITSLIYKIQYRMGKASYLLIPTYNDSFYKITSLVLGSIVICITLITGYFYEYKIYSVVAICVGVIALFNGIFDVPDGKFKIEKNYIIIFSLSNVLDQNELISIEITSDKLLITDKNNNLIKINNLVIDREQSVLIEGYISNNRTNSNLEIMNSVR